MVTANVWPCGAVSRNVPPKPNSPSTESRWIYHLSFPSTIFSEFRLLWSHHDSFKAYWAFQCSSLLPSEPAVSGKKRLGQLSVCWLLGSTVLLGRLLAPTQPRSQHQSALCASSKLYVIFSLAPLFWETFAHASQARMERKHTEALGKQILNAHQIIVSFHCSQLTPFRA